jgi:PEP-CTERM motif
VVGFNGGVQNANGEGFGMDSSVTNISNGDTVQLTLSRSNGLFTLSWQDLTNPGVSGSSPALSFPWLNSFDDLYVGVMYLQPYDTVESRSQLSYFSESVSTPEPASVTLLGLGLTCLMGYAWRRRRWLLGTA